MRKCAQGRNNARGEPLPKRDIVDTSFHASCAEGQGTATGTNLPTTWEKGTEQKQGHTECGINWVYIALGYYGWGYQRH